MGHVGGYIGVINVTLAHLYQSLEYSSFTDTEISYSELRQRLHLRCEYVFE